VRVRKTVHEPATYANPHQLAEGMNEILVNGVLVRRDGTFTSALAGRVVIPEQR
jgi:N-acyl-D-amino-acid deacylase